VLVRGLPVDEQRVQHATHAGELLPVAVAGGPASSFFGRSPPLDLALPAAAALSRHQLDKIVAVRGRPGGIDSDNGTELTSIAILGRIRKRSLGTTPPPASRSGTPSSSFNGRLRD
jgi:hypothetical protein